MSEKTMFRNRYAVYGGLKKKGAYKDALVKQAKNLERELVYKTKSPALGKAQG